MEMIRIYKNDANKDNHRYGKHKEEFHRQRCKQSLFWRTDSVCVTGCPACGKGGRTHGTEKDWRNVQIQCETAD